MSSIIPLSNVEPALVEELLDRAFGENRASRTAYRIRTGVNWLPSLSFAALDQQQMLVGTIQVWPIALFGNDSLPHPLLMIGPVAVVPERQGEGFGKAMMATVLSSLEPSAALPQFLIGDTAYYGQWGFSPQHTSGWRCPGPWEPERLLLRCENSAILPSEGTLGPWNMN